MEEEISSPSMIKCTDKVADMGSNGDVVAQINLAHEDWQKDHTHDEVQGDREDEQLRVDRGNLNLNSNHTHHVGKPRDSLNGCINSMADVEKNQELSVARLDGGRSEGYWVSHH